MSMVELHGVTKRYGTLTVLHNIDLTIEEREFVVFVGPSGSGKSTLLRSIAGLEDVSDGMVSIDERDVTFLEPSERSIAMVFQSYALYPHMNVFRNMAFNLELSRTPKPEIAERIKEAARILQLDDYLQRMPAQLSGGQRQRVAIGRAIVRHPKVFLFDEPLSNLDAALRVQMRLEIERLHRELNTTMIYVTHDQVEAMTLADRIVVLNEGRIQQIGKPLDLYHQPVNRFVAEFIGSPRMNVFEANRVALTLDQGATAIGVRPEHLTLKTGADGVSLPATVRAIERLGNINFAFFETGTGDQLVAQFIGPAPIEGGQTVSLGFNPANAYQFAEDGTTLRSPETPAVATSH